MTALRTVWNNVLRKKQLTEDSLRTDLKKCLSLGDLTFLAIGSMVGSGLYVLTGTVAHDVAGPSVMVSYIIAAIASGLSAVCYAEFGARVPVTGSAYQFTYLSVGEFWAFIIGWNVLIEHVVSASAVAKAWSGYLDAAIGDPVKKYLTEHCPMAGGRVIADYPDFIATGFLILATIVVGLGARLSSRVTGFFAALNLLIVAVIVGGGLYLSDIKNWTQVKGGFFPFGFSGTISGAATLIFSYVGYEVVASTTEEALNPNRDVPLSLFIALSVVVLAYVAASAALTLMVPYYDISILSPFPDAFKRHGWDWARYLVTVGSLLAMTTAMIASMYVVPRYLFAMARDGLLMPFFANVNEKTKVPIISIVVTGVSCILFAIVFQLQILVEFISIGQLLACTFVAICVIKLRYEPNKISKYMKLYNESLDGDRERTSVRSKTVTERSRLNEDIVMSGSPSTNDESTTPQPRRASSLSNNSNTTDVLDPLMPEYVVGSVKREILESRIGYLFQWMTKYTPGTIPNYLLLIACISATVAAIVCLFTHSYISSWWSILLIVTFSLISLTSVFLLLVFNQDYSITTFKVPGVPFVPFISAVVNIILILKLQPMTWVRLGIWVVVGLIVYFAYGYWHSVERKENKVTSSSPTEDPL